MSGAPRGSRVVGSSLVAALFFTAGGASAQVAEPAPSPQPTPATPVSPPTAPPLTPPPGAPPGGHWVYVMDPHDARPSKPAAPNVVMRPVLQHETTWDLNLDGAYGRYFGDRDAWTGFVRARAGLLFIRGPYFDALGLTYEYSSLSNGTFGVQAEVLNLEYGLWAQVGGLLDVSGHPGAMAAVGYSLFGLEAQVRSYDQRDAGIALYAKVRIPVSIIAQIFRPRRATN